MEFLKIVLKTKFQKLVQKTAKVESFQNSGKHKSTKSAKTQWKWPQTEILKILKSLPKDPKMNEIWEFPKQVETERKPNSKIPAENGGEKRENLGKVRFTAYFWKCQKRKNEKGGSLVLFAVFLKMDLAEVIFQKSVNQIWWKTRKTQEFQCTFYGLF